MAMLWKRIFCAALLAPAFATATQPTWIRTVALPCDDAGGETLDVPLANAATQHRLDAFAREQTPPLRDGERIYTCDRTQCATYARAGEQWRARETPVARRAGDDCALVFNGQRVISITTID